MALDLRLDMDNIFLRCGFEEDVVYIDENGAEKTISAVILRGAANHMSLSFRGAGGSPAGIYDIQVFVSTTDVPSVKENSHKIRLKTKLGDVIATTHMVLKILHSDQGAYRLGLG